MTYKLEDLIGKITCADCLDVLRDLPDKCVDLVLTDPPYGIKADKGTNGFGNAKNRRYNGGWDNCTPASQVFDEILRISKTAIIFGGNYFADRLPVSKCWIVWDKKGHKSFKNPFADVELIWTNKTGVCKKYTCIQQGFINEDKDQPRLHPTQKPLRLIKDLICDNSSTGDLILDCFSGSGTTAVAAMQTTRRFICIEKDPEYHAASVKRLEEAQRQQVLF